MTGNPIDTEPTKTFQYAAPIATVSTAYPKYVLGGTTTMNTYDPILAKEYPTCTHGLILGIKKANGGTGYMWQWGSSITTIFKTEYISTKYQTVIDGMASPNYLLIDGSAENTTYVNTKNKTIYERSDYTMIAALHNLSRFMGYNNTKVMEAYALYKEEYNSITSLLGSYTQINGFSQWYIPSLWEFYVMFGGTDEFLTWDGTDESLKESGDYAGFFRWKFSEGTEPKKDADGNVIKENDKTVFQATVTVKFEGSGYNSQSLEETDKYKEIKKVLPLNA
jgi:hypothetical protein